MTVMKHSLEVTDPMMRNANDDISLKSLQEDYSGAFNVYGNITTGWQ